jgi:hypothetical protein
MELMSVRKYPEVLERNPSFIEIVEEQSYPDGGLLFDCIDVVRQEGLLLVLEGRAKRS